MAVTITLNGFIWVTNYFSKINLLQLQQFKKEWDALNENYE
jgi:hypothetical protein